MAFPSGTEVDLLDSRFGFFQQRLAVLLEGFAPFVDGDGILQRNIAALQPSHDVLEFGESLLEGEFGEGRCVCHEDPFLSIREGWRSAAT